MNNATLRLQTFPHATTYLEKLRPYLEVDEARNGLVLGLAERVAIDPHYYGNHDPYFAAVMNGDDIVAAAIMTPPHGVVLYIAPALDSREALTVALTPIAHNLRHDRWPVPAVNGPAAAAECFAAIWSTLVGVTHELAMATRVFTLHEVIHPQYSPGHLQRATVANHELAVQWSREFAWEAEHNEEVDSDRLHKTVAQKIADGQLYFWFDRVPVSMVGLTRPTARGISIGPVYTPPEFRGRGYASSAVAHLSQQMLDSGKEFCSLFTDLANPTSNHIYQEIGYRAVVDFQVCRFLAVED